MLTRNATDGSPTPSVVSKSVTSYTGNRLGSFADGGVEQTDRQPLPSEYPRARKRSSPATGPPPPPPDPVDPPDRLTVDLPASTVDPPVATTAVRARPRRVRARALAAVAIVLAATLVVCLASAIRGDRSADSTGERATRRRPQPATRPSARRGAGSRSPIAAWVAVLEADVNNINEVAYDYGHGTLEGTACRRTQDDAARPPGATRAVRPRRGSRDRTGRHRDLRRAMRRQLLPRLSTRLSQLPARATRRRLPTITPRPQHGAGRHAAHRGRALRGRNHEHRGENHTPGARSPGQVILVGHRRARPGCHETR